MKRNADLVALRRSVLAEREDQNHQDDPFTGSFPCRKTKYEIEDRLLSDERMIDVWKLFQGIKSPKKRRQAMSVFLGLVLAAWSDARDLQRPSSTDREFLKQRRNILRLTEKVTAALKDLSAAAKKIDTDYSIDCRYLADETRRMADWVSKNKPSLFSRSIWPSVGSFLGDLGDAEFSKLWDNEGYSNIRKRGQDNFAERYIRDCVSAYLVAKLDQPFIALADDVAYVVTGGTRRKNYTRKDRYNAGYKRKK